MVRTLLVGCCLYMCILCAIIDGEKVCLKSCLTLLNECQLMVILSFSLVKGSSFSDGVT